MSKAPGAGGGNGNSRAPIVIMGVPFDNVTSNEAIALIQGMIQSRRPHYLATANVDFVVQAQRDVELRRILTEAHLVLCDGTPLVWASRWLGNPLPERVAGADLVPLLMRVAAEQGYRVFLLGATPESAGRAVARLKRKHPSLILAGHYCPPFASLLEMDHTEIKRRIIEAKPDILLVAFGCPKQEKWVWMHYRSLPVPVTVGVGASIDFLAGSVRRAPMWMQRTGTEWVFRLMQEPRRLLKRYLTDIRVFGRGILGQLWHFHRRRLLRLARPGPATAAHRSMTPATDGGSSPQDELLRIDGTARPPDPPMGYQLVHAPVWFDFAAVVEGGDFWNQLANGNADCLLDMHEVKFLDSTAIGILVKMHKGLRASGRLFILVAPSRPVQRALSLMRLNGYFCIADDQASAEKLLEPSSKTQPQSACERPENGVVRWQGEITAGNVDLVWQHTKTWLLSVPDGQRCTIDLSQVPFIDSSGLGLLIRAKKQAVHQQRALSFTGLQPPVRNVLKIARLESFLLT